MKRVALIVLISFLFTMFSCGLSANDSIQRKRVAVVLSGGGAKGMAHIGVMKVIERAGIPVDIITGTSMGSNVGGLYSCGWNAQLLDSIVKQQDWGFLLTDRKVYYAQNLIDRKKQNTYLLSKTFTLGKKNISESGGLIQGKNLDILFRHLTAGYTDTMDFNHLPISFCCVATNIVDNTEYNFHSGKLADAMRTSMSIPGVFSPVRKGEMVLVDGGLRNNYPADLAREMGADYIIGATVQDQPRTADDLVSGSNVLMQIVDINCKNKYDDNLAITDIPIRVNTEGYNAASFTQAAIDTLIRRGEEEAMKHWDELIALKRQLGLPNDYRPQLLRPSTDALKPVNFNDPSENALPMHSRIHSNLGVRFDTEEMVALQLNGVYQSSTRPLNIEATLRLGRNIMVEAVTAWKPRRFVDMSLGYAFRRNEINLYTNGKNNWSVTYNHHQVGLNFLNINLKNFDLDISARADFYNYDKILVTSELNNPGFTAGNEHFFSYHATLHYNSENAGIFPTRGAKFLAQYAYFTDNLTKYKDKVGFRELSASWQMSFALSSRLTFQPLLYGRMLFGDDIPVIRRNFIGGQWFDHYVEQQMPFVGIHDLEATDNQFVACQLKLQEQITTNNFLLLKVVGAQHADSADALLVHGPKLGYSLSYYYRTILGPIGGSLGYSNDTNQVDFFINLGFEF